MTNGYKNECEFAKSINNKKYCDLNDNLKRFIKFIFNDVKDNDILKCKRYKTRDKADVFIRLNNITRNISIKSGIGVSVHEEPINSFIDFLREMNFRKSIIEYLLLYHYGDLTIDGSGETRLFASDLKEKYEEEIKIMNKYFNHKNIIKSFVIRCLFEGTNCKNKADYIYYGNPLDGVYASKEELINYFCNNKASEIKSPHFSCITYQNWNRNIARNPKLESHRYYCQFKWPTIIDDLKKIRENNNLCN